MVDTQTAEPRKGWARTAAERFGIAIAARALWSLVEKLLHH